MAGSNLDYPQGIQPQFAANGETPDAIRVPLKQGIQSTKYATNIYSGGMVWYAATGWIKPVSAAANLTGDPGLYGVADEAYLGSAASTQTDLAVIPITEYKQRFVCQLNNTNTFTNVASLVGKNVNMTAYDDGNTISGRSIMEANAASLTSAAAQFRVVDVLTQDGGTRLGPNAKIVVTPSASIQLWSESVTGT